MSIVTKTGDDGTTSLLFGRRVKKTHPRVMACGSVDELNAVLGLSRANVKANWIKEELLGIQKNLVAIMGELAVAEEDLDKYQDSKVIKFQDSMQKHLESLVVKLEAMNISFEGWVMPGNNQGSAALDLARTSTRRAERDLLLLKEAGFPVEDKFLSYFNRLSDVLWLMARVEDN
ncbi:MAG: cob(I)yrinic acid a,c-diamide adenosyltransferase [Verrucomicrobiota bacterium]